MKVKIKIAWILISGIVISGCESVEREAYSGYDTLFSQVLKSSLDSLNKSGELSGTTISYSKRNFDKVKIKMLEFVNEDFKNDTSYLANMIRKLQMIAGDTADFRLIPSSGAYRLTSQEKSTMTEIDQISLDLSNIAFNENGDQGIFYLALYCGENCGGGYLVYIAKVPDKGFWTAVDLFPI